jgi:hypothetical protein
VGKAASAACLSRVEALAELVDTRYADAGGTTPAGETVTRFVATPTCISVPSSEVAGALVEALDRRGIEAHWVSQDTPAVLRARAYDRARGHGAVIVSIKVLAEGVDLPWLRRLVDARPTMSPVAWVQQLGRVMRPGPQRPHYVCVCRNLERHAYLLSGAVPREAFALAQAAFGAPSKRGGVRALGLEALRDFKAIELPLAGGATGYMYMLYTADRERGITTEYVAILDPTHEEPIVASRQNVLRPGEPAKWGVYAACAVPLDLDGFATSGHRGECSPAQVDWWQRSAERHGLDPGAARAGLSRRAFAALPVLSALRVTVYGRDVAS